MQWRIQPLSEYLGAVVGAGERGRHARGHAAGAGARPAERPDVLFFPVHLRSSAVAGGGRGGRGEAGGREGERAATATRGGGGPAVADWR